MRWDGKEESHPPSLETPSTCYGSKLKSRKSERKKRVRRKFFPCLFIFRSWREKYFPISWEEKGIDKKPGERRS